jgi:hypothetical protein
LKDKIKIQHFEKEQGNKYTSLSNYIKDQKIQSEEFQNSVFDNRRNYQN